MELDERRHERLDKNFLRGRPEGTEEEKSSEDEGEESYCPECSNSKLKLDYKHGELVCRECGLISGNRYIDRGPEWRAFDKKEMRDKARTGAPLTVMQHDRGLSSVIGRDLTDYNGSQIPYRKQRQLYRLREWQRRARRASSVERNLAIALGEIDRMASLLDIPMTIREDASMLYRAATRADLIKGRSIEAVSGASLYIACRQQNVPRTIEEISEVSRISMKDLARTHRFLMDKLNLTLPPTDPIDYIPRFCSELGTTTELENVAKDVLREIKGAPLTYGKAPNSIAAASIYIASQVCGEKVTQYEIATVTKTTEVTVRNRYKEISNHLDMDV